jgi:hypothetical protein
MNETKKMTVEEALTKAWKTIQHNNCGYDDKIVMFYRITPHELNPSPAYIHWFLCSKYTSRNQLYKVDPKRTSWIGNPPDEHFLEQILDECVALRRKMVEAIHNKSPYEFNHVDELESYRASDEVEKIDGVFC